VFVAEPGDRLRAISFLTSAPSRIVYWHLPGYGPEDDSSAEERGRDLLCLSLCLSFVSYYCPIDGKERQMKESKTT
jgi:hypothetical protein